MDIEIIKISANTFGFRTGWKEHIGIEDWNVTFYLEKHSKEIINKIKPITIKVKHIPDSTEDLKELIFEEFSKMFKSEGD